MSLAGCRIPVIRRPGTAIGSGSYQPVVFFSSSVFFSLISTDAATWLTTAAKMPPVLRPHLAGMKGHLQTLYPERRVVLCRTAPPIRARIRCAPALINKTNHKGFNVQQCTVRAQRPLFSCAGTIAIVELMHGGHPNHQLFGSGN